MSKKYLGRINELIRRKLTLLFLEESNDPRFSGVTITAVNTNRDTTRAEIYYSLIGSPEDRVVVQAALDGAAGWFRAQLAPTLRVRNIPQLVFIYDPSLAYGARMDIILEKLHQEEPKNDAEVSSQATETE